MTDKKDSLAKREQQMMAKSGSLQDQLEGFETFATMIAKSPMYSKAFRDKEGNIDEGAILANIVLGNEMGIPPAASVMLGNKLDKKSYFSVIKGKAMGLDPITSINKIYNISTNNGDVIALAVDLVSKAILDSGTSMEYIRDFQAVPMYFDVVSGMYVGHKYNVCDTHGQLKEDYHLLEGKTELTENDKVAKKAGKTFIKKGSNLTTITSLRLVRPDKNINQVFHYSLQEATEAGLYRGYSVYLKDAKGNPIYMEGRNNWNSHPATMLRNRVTSIGGRIIAADILQGAYTTDEVIDMSSQDKTIDVSVIES